MKNDISFFLGTNSGTGFHSLFYDLTEHATPYSTFIIKGGPGTGKSGLMKKWRKNAKNAVFLMKSFGAHPIPIRLTACLFPKSIVLFATEPLRTWLSPYLPAPQNR